VESSRRPGFQSGFSDSEDTDAPETPGLLTPNTLMFGPQDISVGAGVGGGGGGYDDGFGGEFAAIGNALFAHASAADPVGHASTAGSMRHASTEQEMLPSYALARATAVGIAAREEEELLLSELDLDAFLLGERHLAPASNADPGYDFSGEEFQRSAVGIGAGAGAGAGASGKKRATKGGAKASSHATRGEDEADVGRTLYVTVAPLWVVILDRGMMEDRAFRCYFRHASTYWQNLWVATQVQPFLSSCSHFPTNSAYLMPSQVLADERCSPAFHLQPG
jgi:hypothetical protein